MEDVYLLFGSNEGDKVKHIERAVSMVQHKAGQIKRISSLYETEPWGLKEQQSFINQAAQIDCNLAPAILLQLLKSIEHEMGRREGTKWGPRIVDIDILFYGNQIIDTPQLVIPHPFLQDRRFTLEPLNEIAPDLIHPVFHKTIRQLFAECTDTSNVVVV